MEQLHLHYAHLLSAQFARYEPLHSLQHSESPVLGAFESSQESM